MNNEQTKLQQGRHHDPFVYLGRHEIDDTQVIRAFMPSAEQVTLEGYGPMKRVQGTDIFQVTLKTEEAQRIAHHYQLNWKEKHDQSMHMSVSPYSFGPQLGELDLHLFGEGKHQHTWRFLGAHLTTIDAVDGCLFAVWAPHVQRVSVVGDFNGWNGLRHPMRNRGRSGIWELFIPGLHDGNAYKYELVSAQSHIFTKADPYATRMGLRPETTSLITIDSTYDWEDGNWISQRDEWDWQHEAVSIYELHLGSWRQTGKGKFLNYRELANQLIVYITKLGYTHIELLPITEHPLDESWGYQVSAYFAPTSRFGSPDDLRYLIDLCHQHDIGVILDWVPAHFPKDAFALARFTGEEVYEHSDPKRGEHRDWGTLIFDYGRHEVRNFLTTSALYWIEEFHLDGLRVDAVASMLYLDYSRGAGNWSPNQYGGREHIEAIEFLREVNEIVHQRFPGVITIAEESTAWPMVSRPTYMGGLGFSMKWNMGWMHDTLSYMETDPIYRKYNQDKLTFGQLYVWSENFVLPFSHDEVVHLKKSILGKMPGDDWQRFANLRLLYAYQYAHPGKKLLFMGSEFGQWDEWNAKKPLDWALMDLPNHQGIHKLISDLNKLYREHKALHQFDFSSEGFQWIDCHDSEQSVLSFVRRGKEQQDTIVCIFNFTPVPRTNYRIGVPAAVRYDEILNTDSKYYAGSNMSSNGATLVQNMPWMGFSHSMDLALPPLGALFLRRSQ